MAANRAVVGSFEYLDDVLRAVENAKEKGLDYRVYSPVPNHDLEHVTYPEKSNVRVFTLLGALCGITGGFTLAIWCSLDWPMRVSAKEIVSVPAFVVIGYECTILLGAIATLLGMLHFCRIPDILRKVGYSPRFSDDRFGLVVGCETREVDDVKKSLLDSGAELVEVKESL